MRLPNLNKFSYLLIFFFIFTTIVNTEETIDIWKKDNQETTLKNLMIFKMRVLLNV